MKKNHIIKGLIILIIIQSFFLIQNYMTINSYESHLNIQQKFNIRGLSIELYNTTEILKMYRKDFNDKEEELFIKSLHSQIDSIIFIYNQTIPSGLDSELYTEVRKDFASRLVDLQEMLSAIVQSEEINKRQIEQIVEILETHNKKINEIDTDKDIDLQVIKVLDSLINEIDKLHILNI